MDKLQTNGRTDWTGFQNKRTGTALGLKVGYPNSLISPFSSTMYGM